MSDDQTTTPVRGARTEMLEDAKETLAAAAELGISARFGYVQTADGRLFARQHSDTGELVAVWELTVSAKKAPLEAGA